MGAFGVSVWLLEHSRGLFGGPGRPARVGEHLQPKKNPASQAQGGVGEGSLGSLGLGLEDSDLQVVPPNVSTRLEA